MELKQAVRESMAVIEERRKAKQSTSPSTAAPMEPTATPLSREQWLEARRSGIGASEAAAVCGISAGWGATALEVYLDKKGLLPAEKMNVAMRLGIALEPTVAELYTEATGRKLIIPPPLQKHPDTPWIMANPDRYTESGPDQRNVQLKTTAERTPAWGAEGTDEVPEYYICQVQHEMYVTGLRVTDLAVLFLRSKEFAIYTIPYNEEFISRMVEIETDFWQNNVLAGVPPEPDYSHPSTLGLIKTMYPGITDGKALEVAPENVEEIVKTIEMLEAAKEQAKTAKTAIDEHKAFLLGLMEDAAIMTVGDRYTLTRKGVHKNEYTVKASDYIDFRIKNLTKKKGKNEK